MNLDATTRIAKNFYTTAEFKFDGGINLTTNPVDLESNELLSAYGMKYYPDKNSLCVAGPAYAKYYSYGGSITPVGTGWITPRASATAEITSKVPVQVDYFTTPNHLTFYKWDSNSTYPYCSEIGTYTIASEPTCVRFTEFNNVLIVTDGISKAYQILNYSPYTVSEISASTAGAKFSIVFNNYLFLGGFASDPTKIMFSAVGDHTTWPANNFFYIGAAGDVEPVTGFAICYSSLIIFRRKSIFVLTGTSTDDFTLSQISSSIGMPSNMACCGVENSCWFINETGPYKISSSLTLQYMGEKIKSDFWGKAILTDGTSSTIAVSEIVYSPKTNCVYLAYPYSAASPSACMYIFNLNQTDSSGIPAITQYQLATYNKDYRGNQFQVVSGPYFSKYNVNNDQLIFIGNTNGTVWAVDCMAGDSASISYSSVSVLSFQTRYYNLGSISTTKKIRFIRIIGNIDPTPISLTVYCRNGMSAGETPQSYTISNFVVTEGKISLPESANFTGRYFSFKFDGIGTGLVNGIIIEFVDFGRRL